MGPLLFHILLLMAILAWVSGEFRDRSETALTINGTKLGVTSLANVEFFFGVYFDSRLNFTGSHHRALPSLSKFLFDLPLPFELLLHLDLFNIFL